MKPIQEYTKQEKLAAILEYNPCRTERNAVLRYLLAVRRDDADEIAYFESFGDCIHHIIHNVCTYERGLLFGYTAKQFDEYGYFGKGCIELDDAEYKPLSLIITN